MPSAAPWPSVTSTPMASTTWRSAFPARASERPRGLAWSTRSTARPPASPPPETKSAIRTSPGSAAPPETATGSEAPWPWATSTVTASTTWRSASSATVSGRPPTLVPSTRSTVRRPASPPSATSSGIRTSPPYAAMRRRGDLFGNALAVGDFDGDGFDDLAIGAPGEGLGLTPARRRFGQRALRLGGRPQRRRQPVLASEHRRRAGYRGQRRRLSAVPWPSVTSTTTASTIWRSESPARTSERRRTPVR